MSNPSFALPDQLRYGHATLSSLGTDMQVAVVVPYTGSSPIIVQAGSYLLWMFPNPVKIVYLIQWTVFYI